MSVPTFHPTPNVEKGVKYWQGVPATVDGVLGGYGNGTLPIVDAQGSRAFLLDALPRLSAVAPASVKQSTDDGSSGSGSSNRQPTRALDCGAGVGRVTRDVLSRIVDVVHIVEPVDNFLNEAKRNSASWPAMQTPPSKAPFKARKAIHFHLSTLQSFDPARPFSTSSRQDEYQSTFSIADEGGQPDVDEPRTEPVQYDVVWGQWCLQHLSDKDLLAFFERYKACLRKPNGTETAHAPSSNAVLDGAGIIVVKENVLRDTEDGSERVWYDDEDHSITRTPNAYERIFKQANLQIVRTEVQRGLPEELFPVQMWCLRIPV